MQRKRPIEIIFFLSEEENQRLRENVKKTGFRSRSAYIRKMVLEGYVVQQDYKSLRDVIVELKRIGNNLNQIARIANIYHEINLPGIEEVRKELDHWRQRILKALP